MNFTRSKAKFFHDRFGAVSNVSKPQQIVGHVRLTTEDPSCGDLNFGQRLRVNDEKSRLGQQQRGQSREETCSRRQCCMRVTVSRDSAIFRLE